MAKIFVYSYSTKVSVTEFYFVDGLYKKEKFRPGNGYWNIRTVSERGSAFSRQIIYLLEKECADRNINAGEGVYYVDTRKVFSRIPEGSSEKEVMGIIKDEPDRLISFKPRHIKRSNDLVLKTRVRVERETGNKNRETFDFVRVIHSLRDIGGYTALLDRVEKEKRHLVDAALEAIKGNRSYQKYGVPVSYLNITSVTVTRDGCCEILFELKGRGD